MNLQYVLAGVLRHWMPERLLFALLEWRKGGNSAETDPEAHFRLWKEWFDQYEIDLIGKHVVEIGSGRYARIALRLLAAGAKQVTLVDPHAVALADAEHRLLLLGDMRGLGLDAQETLPRIQLVTGDLAALPSPADERRADVIISNAVMEHVRDPDMAFRQCSSWLRLGGKTCHVIDLRDHNLQFRSPFEMLTFSEAVWSRWLDPPGGFHMNRWRANDYVRALQAAGFADVNYQVLIRDAENLRLIKPRLHPRFRQLEDDVLAIVNIVLCGTKMAVQGQIT